MLVTRRYPAAALEEGAGVGPGRGDGPGTLARPSRTRYPSVRVVPSGAAKLPLWVGMGRIRTTGHRVQVSSQPIERPGPAAGEACLPGPRGCDLPLQAFQGLAVLALVAGVLIIRQGASWKEKGFARPAPGVAAVPGPAHCGVQAAGVGGPRGVQWSAAQVAQQAFSFLAEQRRPVLDAEALDPRLSLSVEATSTPRTVLGGPWKTIRGPRSAEIGASAGPTRVIGIARLRICFRTVRLVVREREARS
mmetsp:Transcript_141527/g.246731  ORF Transcript_141527/g.246731 Transcript_141527/m.246731 type:complete len:248 (-) Transcript_141527:1800-2543(-)